MQSSLAGRLAAAILTALALSLLVPLAGCTREKYFRRADREVKGLLEEKSDDPRWALPEDYTVCMDPRSRYWDPYDAVRPPMPEDDPASHRFMHWVDSKKGYCRWHADGDRPELENPCWRERLGEYVTLTDDNKVKLSLESAVALARIHSPDYQEQLETLYLSALDVSTERFRFDVQFYGGNETTFHHQGRLRPGGENNTLTTFTDPYMTRRFATAGQLLVEFANTYTWQFFGADTSHTFSLLRFDLVQPLLRRAGRVVALEQLTIAERALLANLRAFQRYRHGFFTRVAIGESGVSGPQRRGGFFGGTGLTGFTGTGSGGFGGVGESTGFGRAGFGGAGGAGGGGGAGFAGGGEAAVGGFIGLLQSHQQIRNSQESLGSQVRTLRLLEAHLQAGTIDLTQVDQFRQNIETSRANLLQAVNNLESSLDSYKTGTLGLPPDLPLDLDDAMIRQFQFIDPAISQLQNRLSDFVTDFGQQPAEPPLEVLREAFDKLAALQAEAEAQFARVAEDLAKADQSVPARQDALTPPERQQLADDLAKLRESYAQLKDRLAKSVPRLEQIRRQLAPATRGASADKLVELVSDVTWIVDELSLVQARARTERITVQHEPLSPEDALAIARANRLDWMNNRAALVDTWRLIAYNANFLKSDVSVTFSGDMQTVGENPVKFRAPNGNLRVGLQFDPPFTRLLERNNFRQVLIDYQRDRRRLIQYEDSVYQTLRQYLRYMERLRRNLEIQRQAVIIAIRRVDRNREVLNEPPPAPQPGQPTVQLGPTAALNLLTAMNDLQSTQNNFMSVWLAYQATRMRLARDLGIMELDANEMWIDQPLSDADRASAEELPLPPAVPEEWIKELESSGPSVKPEEDTSPPPLSAPPRPGMVPLLRKQAKSDDSQPARKESSG